MTTKSALKGTKTSAHSYAGSVAEVHASLLEDGRKKEATELVRRLVSENEKLARDLAQLRHRLGKKGEGVSKAQLELLLSELAASQGQSDCSDGEAKSDADVDADVLATCARDADENATTTPPRPPDPKRGNKRKPLPDRLERRPNELLLQGDARCCPQCGSDLKTIEFEPSEVIDFTPAKVFIRVDLRERAGCQGCKEVVVRAPLGDKVIAGGLFGSAIVAEFVVRKYRDGLSLHRIREQMQRLGIDIPSSTISDQVLWAADLLEPIYRELICDVVRAHLMQLDGTSLSVMHEDKEQGRHKFLGSITGAIGDGVSAVYVYASSGHKTGQRQGDMGPEDLLRQRPKGLVLADASNHYDASFKRHELIEVGCNMHARRGFAKALAAGNQRASVALRAFKQLYDIEEEHEASTAAVRLSARQTRSVPIYDALIQWCRELVAAEPPSSLLAVASRYAIRHEIALRRFLADGRIPIDNGAVERMHRRPAIVRKNMLFAGSHDGARRAAVMFSIFATCELLGVNPALYLADVFPKLARGISIRHDLPALMPGPWLARNPEACMPILNAVTTVVEFRDA